jgi:hypothetical protein
VRGVRVMIEQESNEVGTPYAFTAPELARLRIYQAAVQAGFYNEDLRGEPDAMDLQAPGSVWLLALLAEDKEGHAWTGKQPTGS